MSGFLPLDHTIFWEVFADFLRKSLFSGLPTLWERQPTNTNMGLNVSHTQSFIAVVQQGSIIKKCMDTVDRKTSLQVQILSVASPPIGKINPISKTVVTVEPIMLFDALQDLENF